MHTHHSVLGRATGALLVALAALTASCQNADELTAPASAPAYPARPATDPTVTGVVPDSSKRGVRLDITVSGSGYDQGSVVALERDGAPAAGVTVNATTFVTARKVIADVSIAATADTGKLDVAVTTSGGRKGVGIELFVVQYEIAELGMFGGTWSLANDINDQGEIVGTSCTADCLSRAFRWTEAGGLEDLGTLPGWSRSFATTITEQGKIFGSVKCFPDDPGCSEPFTTQQVVRWDKVEDSWVITPVNGCTPTLNGLAGRFVVNDNEQCVSAGSPLMVQTLSGGTVVNQEPLPTLATGAFAYGLAISNLPMVVGIASDPAGAIPVLWYRRTDGTWEILQLGFPSTEVAAYAEDVGEPDAEGRVHVAGYSLMASRFQPSKAMRWTLEPDGLGGWTVVTTEIFESTVRQRGQANAWAIGINNAGDMVGIAGSHTTSGMPVKWSADGSAEVLPVSTGTAQGSAVKINNHGWIIGSVWDPHNECNRAAVWRQNVTSTLAVRSK